MIVAGARARNKTGMGERRRQNEIEFKVVMCGGLTGQLETSNFNTWILQYSF